MAQVGGGQEPEKEPRADGTKTLRHVAAGCGDGEACNQKGK